MSLAITNTFSAGSTIIAADINQNFTDVVNKFGNIDNSDVKTGAAIAISKLAAQSQELLIVLHMHANDLAAGWPGASATIPLYLVPIPGSNGDIAWALTDASWVCNDTGDGLGQFHVRYGEFDSAGAWTTVSTPVATTVISNAAAANDANQGKALENGNVSLAFSTKARSLGLFSTNPSATSLTAANSYLTVSLILKRNIIA